MKRVIRQHLRRAVVVTLKTGEGFRGVLYEADSEAFVMRNCLLVDAENKGHAVDGELVVLRADVAFMQFT